MRLPKGAYIVRDYKPGVTQGGTFIVQGTSAMVSITKLLPVLDEQKINVKIIYAASSQLFAMQPEAYQNEGDHPG